MMRPIGRPSSQMMSMRPVAHRLRIELMLHQLLAHRRIELDLVPLGQARVAEQLVTKRLVLLALGAQQDGAERRDNRDRRIHAVSMRQAGLQAASLQQHARLRW